MSSPTLDSSGYSPRRRSDHRVQGEDDRPMPPSHPGLPLARPVERRRIPSIYYCITVVDSRGRLADRSALHAMRWPAAQMVDFAVGSGAVAVTGGGSSGWKITKQGHLRLPPDIRHMLGIAARDRLIVAADKHARMLVVGTMSWLDRALGVSTNAREAIER